jgi:hypothetical protein
MFDQGKLLAAVQRVLPECGLPSPSELNRLASPWPVYWFRLSFEEPEQRDLVLHLCKHDLDGVGFWPAVAARAALAGTSAVPLTPVVVPLPAGIMSSPALLTEAWQGTPGSVVCRQAGLRAPVHRSVGQVLAALERRRLPEHGLAASRRGFVARHDTWREAWTARVYRRAEAARRAGTALQSLFRRLLERIEELAPALDEVTEWSVVHGRLQVSELTFRRADDQLRLAAVLGWHDAWVGDPLSGWGKIMHSRDEVLDDVLDGYGRREYLLEPVSLARLELYQLSDCVNALAEAGLAPLGRWQRPSAIQAAARLSHAALHGTAAKRLLDGRPHAPPSVHHALVRIRQPLETLRMVPGLREDHAPVWTAGTAALLLQRRLELAGAGEEVCVGYVGVAQWLLDRLPEGRTGLWRPILDRGAFVRSAVLNLVLAPRHARRHRSLTVAWLALESLDALGHVADDGVLRGWSELIKTLAARDKEASELTHLELLFEGLMGWTAAAQLAERFSIDAGVTVDFLRRQVEQAWAQVSVPARDDDPLDWDDWVVRLAERAAHLSCAEVAAPALIALDRLPEAQLPASKTVLLHALVRGTEAIRKR